MRGGAIIGLLVVSLPAHAQEAGDRDIGKAHFEAGRGYYAKAEYDRALREFQAAYELTGLADLQYNVAQCHERLFQAEQALAAYRLYLANGKPTDQDRAFVEKRIALLEKQVAGRRQAPAAQGTAQPAVPPAPATAGGRPAPAPSTPTAQPTIDAAAAPSAETEPDAWYRSWWIWGAAGGTVIGVVVTALVLSGGADQPEPIYQGDRASLPLP